MGDMFLMLCFWAAFFAAFYFGWLPHWLNVVATGILIVFPILIVLYLIEMLRPDKKPDASPPLSPPRWATKESFVAEVLKHVVVPAALRPICVEYIGHSYDEACRSYSERYNVDDRLRSMTGELSSTIRTYLTHLPAACLNPPTHSPLYYPFLNGRIPYQLPTDARFSGHWIVAIPDSGKTNLLNGMILEDVKQVAEGNASVIIIDSKTVEHENLIDRWRKVNFTAFDRRLAGRVHIFDPDADLAINIFQMGDVAQVIEIIEYMFSSLLDIKPTELQSAVLSPCVTAIKASPKPSLTALADLLRDGSKKYERYIRTLDETDQDFFFRPGIDGKTPDFETRDSLARREELRRRLSRLSKAVPVLTKTFASTEHKIDLRKLIDDGNIIIVNAKTRILRDKGSEFFQRLWTMMLRDAAEKRKRYTPVFCYIDEAHRGIAKDIRIADILDQCRSAKVALIMAHQGESQIDDKKVLSALGRCAIKCEAASKKGDFIAAIRRDQPITLSTIFTDMNALPQLTASQEAELRAEMRRRYSVSTPSTPASGTPTSSASPTSETPIRRDADDPSKAANY
jgi:hypothetical protein